MELFQFYKTLQYFGSNKLDWQLNFKDVDQETFYVFDKSSKALLVILIKELKSVIDRVQKLACFQ